MLQSPTNPSFSFSLSRLTVHFCDKGRGAAAADVPPAPAALQRHKQAAYTLQ
jgi:hypothetical protein